MTQCLFIGVQAAGISYADTQVIEAGDYKKLAFLPYDTLKLEFYPGCPADLRAEITQDASLYKKGQIFQTSACGQTVKLGTKQ